MTRADCGEVFEPLKAAVDPTYLFSHVDAARAFADEALDLKRPDFVQALKIKGVLKERVDFRLLLQALDCDRACRDEVLFYLSRVSVHELEGQVIEFINIELERDGEPDAAIYWMIRALVCMNTKTARFFLDGLRNHPKIRGDEVLAALV
ncbi:hypothetical protein HY604_02545 [Candidatus Peregrinibacteria bacterium]|nr:hypothetical protein [Candidatus Peregrinibacteria bacterium]